MRGAFRIGQWLIQPHRNQIAKSGHEIHLEPRVMQVLVFLAEHPGDVISREKILESVWSDTYVSDEVLTTAIRDLRRALGDDPKDPHFIKTFPKKGYQLLTPVSFEEQDETELGAPTGARAVAPHSPTSWRRRVKGGLGVALVFAVGFAMGVAYLKRRYPISTAGQLTRFAMALPQDCRLMPGDRHGAVAISPEGTRIVYRASCGDNPPQLFVREMGELEATPIPETTDGHSPFFSPDGKWVAFFSDKKLKKISLPGGAVITLCDASLTRGATWAPDDTILLNSGDGTGLWRVSAEGGMPEALTLPGITSAKIARSHGPGYLRPHMLPGGMAMLYTIFNVKSDKTPHEARIAAYSFETNEQNILVAGGNNPRYAPSGHLVYECPGALQALPFELSRLEVREPVVRVLEGLRTYENSAAPQFDFSSSGTLVYVPGGREPGRTLVWVDRDGVAEPIGGEERAFTELRFSPDGRRIAVSIGGARLDIWTYDLPRGVLTPITHRGDNYTPTWTPDGERIVFTSNRTGIGYFQIFSIAADGSGNLEQLLESDSNQQPWSISPDGRTLAFQELQASGFDLWTLPLEGDRQPQVFLATEFDERHPTFSPDGRAIAYTSNESGREEIYVRPYPRKRGKWKISRNGGTDPLWAPDGRQIYYRQADKVMVVLVESEPEFRPGRPRTLFERRYARPVTAGFYDIAPDGQRFLMLMADQEPITHINVVLNWFQELKRLVPAR